MRSGRGNRPRPPGRERRRSPSTPGDPPDFFTTKQRLRGPFENLCQKTSTGRFRALCLFHLVVHQGRTVRFKYSKTDDPIVPCTRGVGCSSPRLCAIRREPWLLRRSVAPEYRACTRGAPRVTGWVATASPRRSRLQRRRYSRTPPRGAETGRQTPSPQRRRSRPRRPFRRRPQWVLYQSPSYRSRARCVPNRSWVVRSGPTHRVYLAPGAWARGLLRLAELYTRLKIPAIRWSDAVLSCPVRRAYTPPMYELNRWSRKTSPGRVKLNYLL